MSTLDNGPDVKRTRVRTPGAPPALGPYSQAIVANGMVFCTGQVALDPETSQIVGDDIETQTRQVLMNLQAVLNAAGSDLQYVVQATVFLAQFSDFAAMNDVYDDYFAQAAPARSTVECGLPRNILVQIDCIAIVPSMVRSVEVIEARESRSTFNLDFDADF
jgi:2-iminobutanoate/2-iminopropanoate deaminase